MWWQHMTHGGATAMEPVALVAGFVGAAGLALRQRRRMASERRRASRTEEELLAYLLLNDWKTGDAQAMGRRICRAISRHSVFGASALLVPNEDGRLRVVTSTRADDLSARALERWADAQLSLAAAKGAEHQDAEDSQDMRRPRLIRLERRAGYQPGDPAALAWSTALVVPMCTDQGAVVGALAVCADRFRSRPVGAVESALRPLEMLAARYAAAVTGMGPATQEQAVQGGAAESGTVGDRFASGDDHEGDRQDALRRKRARHRLSVASLR